MSKSPMPGSVTRSKVTSKPTTGISAISVTPSELAARGDAVEVVEEPERGDQQRADEDAEVGALEVDQDRRRDQDPGDDREPADARDRALVHARAVGLVVEPADQRGEAADERREHEHEHGGDDEAHQGVAVPASVLSDSPKDM